MTDDDLLELHERMHGHPMRPPKPYSFDKD